MMYGVVVERCMGEWVYLHTIVHGIKVTGENNSKSVKGKEKEKTKGFG